LFAGEVVSRWTLRVGQPGVAFHRCDWQLGWRGISRDAFDLRFPDGEVRIVRNSRGMHDREHDPRSSTTPYRVMLLGDSFVESLQVSEKESHHQLLEDAFRGRLEVVNAGIGGWSLAQELLYFENEGSSYRPDLVILFWFVGNDLSDLLPAARYQTCGGEDCYSPYFVLREESLELWRAGRNTPVGRPDLYRFGRRRAAQVLYDVQSISSLGRRMSELLPKQENSPGFAPEGPWSREEDPAVESVWHLTEALLSRLKRDVAEDGGRLAVVVVPLNRAVEAELAQEEWSPSAGGLPLPPNEARRPNERMQTLAAKLDLPVLDLQGPFLEDLKRGGSPPFWPDSHWSRHGNRVAAAAVEGWLRSLGLGPVSEPRVSSLPEQDSPVAGLASQLAVGVR
jgi:hypothetical protein